MNTPSAACASSSSSQAWRSRVTMMGIFPAAFLTLRQSSASGLGMFVTAIAPCRDSKTPSSSPAFSIRSTMRLTMTSKDWVVSQLPMPTVAGRPVPRMPTSSTSS